MPTRAPRLAALLTAAALLAGGCDTSINAFSEAEGAYSVFGYLDASAPVQVVRVEPIQDSVLLGTEPFDASVTTQNLATGETVVWRKEVVDLNPNPELDLVVQNYWTRAELEPEATYRFTMEGAEGVATADVTLPPDFPLPTVEDPPDLTEPVPDTTVVVVRGVERLGAVVAAYSYRVCEPVPRGEPICRDAQRKFSHLADTTRRAGGAYEIRIDWAADLERAVGGGAFLDAFYSFQVTVASVSEDWPEYDFPVREPGDPPPPQPPVPGLDSNIENGLGYLGGAVTKTVDIPIEQ